MPSREDLCPAHPEIAIGIPSGVVTARAEFKAKWAQLCGYTGPLTLAEAVQKNRIPAERAQRLVDAWERSSHRQFGEMRAPMVPRWERRHPAVKPSEVA